MGGAYPWGFLWHIRFKSGGFKSTTRRLWNSRSEAVGQAFTAANSGFMPCFLKKIAVNENFDGLHWVGTNRESLASDCFSNFHFNKNGASKLKIWKCITMYLRNAWENKLYKFAQICFYLHSIWSFRQIIVRSNSFLSILFPPSDLKRVFLIKRYNKAYFLWNTKCFWPFNKKIDTEVISLFGNLYRGEVARNLFQVWQILQSDVWYSAKNLSTNDIKFASNTSRKFPIKSQEEIQFLETHTMSNPVCAKHRV